MSDAFDVRAVETDFRQRLLPARRHDWSRQAGDLDWSCRETLDHVANTLAFYIAHFGSSATRHLVHVRTLGDETLSISDLLEVVQTLTAVLSRLLDSSAPGERGWHPTGKADAEGFAAMACNELVVHGWDIASGLGLSYVSDGGLAGRIVARLFPDAVVCDDAWRRLLRANGRVGLPGHELLPDLAHPRHLE